MGNIPIDSLNHSGGNICILFGGLNLQLGFPFLLDYLTESGLREKFLTAFSQKSNNLAY